MKARWAIVKAALVVIYKVCPRIRHSQPTGRRMASLCPGSETSMEASEQTT